MTLRRIAGPPLDAPPWTVPDALRQAAEKHGARPAILARDGTVTTWAELVARMERLAHALLAWGLRRGDRVAIVSETRAEWSVADAAVLLAGGVVVAVFPTLPRDQVATLLRDSGARFAFLEDASQWAKVRDAPGTQGVERWVLFEGDADKPATPLADAEAEGARSAERAPRALAERLAEARPDDLATLVYTSGTTGKQKGVMLTHANLVASGFASIQALRLRPHPTGLAFLPLAHSYQRQNAIVLILLAGSVTYSAPSRLADDLRAARPTLLPAVPRLYERMHERIHEKVREMPARRQAVFRAAERTAREYGDATLRQRPVPLALRARHALFERLVYRRLRRQAGFDRLELAVTGAAAMRPDLHAFFEGIGVRIVEGWGLSETTAPATVNPPHAPRLGTVGPCLPGVDVALADDDEILVKGPVVFQGYDGLPDDTAEAFVEVDGARWFRTGDLGAIDEAGHLRIVDRKKDLEVLDTGKKVPPMPIEEALKASPLVAEALVVATGRKIVGALLQPDYDALLAWARERGLDVPADGVRRGKGAAGEDATIALPAAFLARDDVRAEYQRAIDAVNAPRPPHEHVRVFRLVPEAFRIETGELTPTLKKKRAAILQRHAALVDAMFGPR